MKDILFKSEFYENIDYFRFFLGLGVLIILTKIMEFVYNKYSDSPTNKKSFSAIFVLFSVSIFLIVTTIKSSLALSLGMVGALSIIRLRTAIKEPEQLIYFLGITGVAIATAAQKEILAIIVVVVFILSAVFKNSGSKKKSSTDLKHLMVSFRLNLENKDSSVSDIATQLFNLELSEGLKCKNYNEDDKGNLRMTFIISNLHADETRIKIKEIFNKSKIEQFNIKMIE